MPVRLGHAGVRITADIYSHVTPRKGEESVRRIRDVLAQGDFAAVSKPS